MSAATVGQNNTFNALYDRDLIDEKLRLTKEGKRVARLLKDAQENSLA